MKATLKAPFLILALLSAGVLATACSGAFDSPREAAAPTTAEAPAASPAEAVSPAESPTPSSPPEATTPEADGQGEATATTDTDVKERELALRQRELDLRERELAAREAEIARRSSRPAPAPHRERTPAAAPAPEPAPAAEPAAPAPETAGEEPEPYEEPAPRTVSVDLPAGTQIDVEFLSSLSSAVARPGDTFRTRVSSDLHAGGEVVVPAGSEVLGRVVEAQGLKKIGGQARLILEFTDLVLPSGATVPIEASFAREGENQTKKDATAIGAGALGGAILGRIIDRKHKGKGTVLGAIVGAAAGSAIAAKRPGEEVEIPEGSVVSLTLDRPLHYQLRR